MKKIISRKGRTTIGLILRIAVCVAAVVFAPVSVAFAQTIDVGVDVIQTTTTTTTTSSTTTTVLPTTTSSTTTSTFKQTTTTVTPNTIKEGTDLTLPRLHEDPEPEVKKTKGVVESITGAAKTTTKIISEVAKGKPAAEVLEAVLSEDVAEVVVPAVRTASTFVFPIGLVFAVVGFLIIQTRIDASDPKLIASPITHDDDEVHFR